MNTPIGKDQDQARVKIRQLPTGVPGLDEILSFLAEDIVRLRYVSINGQLRKMLLVVKMRGSQHSIDMVEYSITSQGMVIGEPLRGYRGLTSGIPGPWSSESGGIPQLRSEPEGEPHG